METKPYREVLNSIKELLDIKTDVQLAEAMGIEYGAMTSALSRNSIQFEPVIKFINQNNLSSDFIFAGIVQDKFKFEKFKPARDIIDTIKKETGIGTDRALAEEMEVKYPTFANWITRNSLQLELVINYLLQKGIDLNIIFSGTSNNSKPKSRADTPAILNTLITKYESYSRYGTAFLDPFKSDIEKVLADYDVKADILKTIIEGK